MNVTRATKQELAWREWWLGEGKFQGHPHDPSMRYITGAPEKVPLTWWQRLEAFLVRRHDYAEAGRKPSDEPDSGGRRILHLSPHFDVKEFDCHDGRKVPAVAMPALGRLCTDLLEPLRAHFGPAFVLSGYRPEDYNRKIGGAKYSQHIYELTPSCVAADLSFRTGTAKDWAEFADHLGAGGVGRYDRSGFVHVDNRPGRARWTG